MHNGFTVWPYMHNKSHYGGVTRKYGITVDGTNYIVKHSPRKLITSIYSEYVASKFIKCLGIPCQEVWIGDSENELVNIIKDFKQPGEVLKAFEDTGQSSVDSTLEGKLYTYDDVLYLIENHTKMSVENKQKMIDQFWDQFTCDAILGNRDRHKGNWGFLTSGNQARPAPIYDNGGSLFPDMGALVLNYKEDRYKFLVERSEKFPASVFQKIREDGRPRRTNYYEVFGEIEPTLLAKRLTLQKVWEAAVAATDFVTPLYSDFYKDIICMRFLHIIKRLSFEEAYDELRHYTR